MAAHYDPNDEEEEEEEPKLKYERVGRGVEELLQRDTVSCLVAHEKFIVRCRSAGGYALASAGHHFRLELELKNPRSA